MIPRKDSSFSLYRNYCILEQVDSLFLLSKPNAEEIEALKHFSLQDNEVQKITAQSDKKVSFCLFWKNGQLMRKHLSPQYTPYMIELFNSNAEKIQTRRQLISQLGYEKALDKMVNNTLLIPSKLKKI